jgi:hypothetical protein
MQSYSIKYKSKIKMQNKQIFVYESTAIIDASSTKFAIKKLRRKVKSPINVIDINVIGYY